MRGESNEDQKIAAFGSSYMESRRTRTQLGRVSARLLLILEPVGRLSGRDSYGESIERRCSEANRRRCPRMNPKRRNPSPSEGRTSGHRPLVTLGWAGTPAFAKVTRRKGGTIIRNTRKTGYSPKALPKEAPQLHPVQPPKKSPTQPPPSPHPNLRKILQKPTV